MNLGEPPGLIGQAVFSFNFNTLQAMVEKIKDGISQYLTPILMAVVAFFLREVYNKVDAIANELKSLSEDRAVMRVEINQIKEDLQKLEIRLDQIEKKK